jgi:hypothetical protein
MVCIPSLLLLWTVCTGAHPLHLSVTNITFENGKIAVSMKSFRDDWETAYYHYYGRVADFTDPAMHRHPWFSQYLMENFRISTSEEGSPLVLKIDTVILDEESMTIGMVSTLPVNGEEFTSTAPKSLYIYSTVLTDIFPDQTNLVIIGFNKRETGIKFDVRKHGEEVLLK